MIDKYLRIEVLLLSGTKCHAGSSNEDLLTEYSALSADGLLSGVVSSFIINQCHAK